jgi:hypothetical protein
MDGERCLLPGEKGAEFLRGVQTPIFGEVIRFPDAQLLAKDMGVVSGLGGKAVCDGPAFFQKRVGIHGSESLVNSIGVQTSGSGHGWSVQPDNS